MSFPDAGQAIPSTETGNIKFSDLRSSYLSNESSGGNNQLNDEGGVLSLSFFRGVAFTSGDPIPESGAISIGTDFSGKTFASANVRISLSDSFGDGWDDDGDGGGIGGTTNNFLIITDSSSNEEVFNNTNTDVDGLTAEPETIIYDITLPTGNYNVEVSLASGQSSFGEFAFDMSYSITLISDSSVLDSYDFGSEGVPESGNYTSSFSIS
jgi:hypothetical protein